MNNLIKFPIAFFTFYASLALAIERPRDMISITLTDHQTNNIEKQTLDNSCGLASLSYVLNNYYNKKTSEQNLFAFIGLKPEYSILDLHIMSTKFNISSVGLKLSIKDLKKIKSPAILKTKTNGGHFIVYTGYKNGWFQIIDPARGRLNYLEPELSSIFIEDDSGHGKSLVFLSQKKNRFIEAQLYGNSTNRLWLEKQTH